MKPYESLQEYADKIIKSAGGVQAITNNEIFCEAYRSMQKSAAEDFARLNDKEWINSYEQYEAKAAECEGYYDL